MPKLRSLVRGLALLFGVVPSSLPAGELVFDPIEVPTSAADKAVTRATNGATVDGRRIALAFQPLLQGGAKYGAGTFALSLNANGQPVKDGKGDAYISNYPDFTSLFSRDGHVLGVTHFESLPSALYLSRFAQDRKTGTLTAIETRSLRLAPHGGIFNPCAGMVTPWGTHLGGEEYPPDMRAFGEALATRDKTKLTRWIPRKLRYFGLNPETPDFDAIKAQFKPYRYGYPFEVNVKAWSNVDVKRHHAMGRFSHELAYVMPDRRTVYMSDDGDNTGFFLFVADRAADLSAGRLFAAKWEQIAPAAGATDATAKLSWIDLGHATSAAIARGIEAGTTFDTLFETAEMATDGQCPTGFGAVNFVGEITRRSGECLKVRPTQSLLASRLETRRFAALKGATTEFNKAEGMTYDPKRKRLYKAITSIDRGMADASEKGKASDRFERGGPNHIRLAYNPCGVVYGLDLARDDKIGSDYVAKGMSPVITGKPAPGATGPFNTCALDGIANPDNLTFIPEHDTLIIAEDSDGGHENDAVWAFDVGRGKLTRILTVPQGGEASGVYWYPNINGHGYLTAVVQHPFAENVLKHGVKPPSDDAKHKAAIVGVIGPFPTATAVSQKK